MENFICVHCGAQFSQTAEPPSQCPICQDERQFVRHDGQQWTTLQELALHHRNRFEEEAPQLLGIGTEPEFAIAQRALLVQSPAGNLLWDCISLLEDRTIAEVRARGGIRAIAISHPHFYSSMVKWAERFDAQIYLHIADRQWVMRKSPRIHFWEGTTYPLWDDLTLINCGGHFEGGTVLHWPAGGNGKGALLTSDILTVVQDRRFFRIHFYQLTSPTSCSHRPINNVTKKRGRSGDDNQIAIAAPQKIFYYLDLGCVQLLAEPDHTRSHILPTLLALRQTAIVMLLFMLISSEFATRTACHENVAVDLHYLLCR